MMTVKLNQLADAYRDGLIDESMVRQAIVFAGRPQLERLTELIRKIERLAHVGTLEQRMDRPVKPVRMTVH